MCNRLVKYHKQCKHSDQTVQLCGNTACFLVDLPLTLDGLPPIQVINRVTQSSNGECRKCRLKTIDPLIEDDQHKRLCQEREVCKRYNREKSARPPNSIKRWLARPRLVLVYERGQEKYVVMPQWVEFPIVDISNLPAEDSICAICFESYRNNDGSLNENCVRLPCEHIMGETCADSLFRANKGQPQLMDELDEDFITCPFCRHPLVIVQHDHPAKTDPEYEEPLGS